MPILDVLARVRAQMLSNAGIRGAGLAGPHLFERIGQQTSRFGVLLGQAFRGGPDYPSYPAQHTGGPSNYYATQTASSVIPAGPPQPGFAAKIGGDQGASLPGSGVIQYPIPPSRYIGSTPVNSNPYFGVRIG